MRLALIVASWQARSGHPDEARQTLATMTEANPELAATLPALDKSLTTRPVASASEGMAEAYMVLAAALRLEEADQYAMLLLQLSLGLRPGFTPARLLMADILDNGHHPAHALRVLQGVAAGDPLQPVVQLRRAVLLEETGSSEQAMQVLEQLAQDYPTRPEAPARMGDILRSKGRFTEAIAAYDRAIARVPNPDRAAWPLFYDRGIAYERAKQWPQAEADFMTALQLSPNEPFVLNYLGYSWTEQGRNLPRARQMIEQALQQRPNDGAIADSLGWVMLRQGETAAAVRQLEKAVELDPEDATLNGHLGDAYWAAGRKREAQFQWRRALTLNPEPAEVPGLQAKLHEAESGAVAASGSRRVVQ